MDTNVHKALEANASKTLLVSDCMKEVPLIRRSQRLRGRAPGLSLDTLKDREKARLAENPSLGPGPTPKPYPLP